MRRRLAAALFALLAAGPALPAHAEAVRIEAVGVAAVGEGAPGGIAPRDAALRAGLADAVLRTALELLAARGVAVEPATVTRALGDDPHPYTLRFRLLEDRGERRRLLLEDPAVPREYVVLVEAFVERERVAARLAEAGLVARAFRSGGPTLRVALEGLASWARYREIRDLLARSAGPVRPVEFARGRAVLEVDTDRAPAEVLDGLQRGLPGAVELVPLALGGRDLRLRVVDRKRRATSRRRPPASRAGSRRSLASRGAGGAPAPPRAIDTLRRKGY